jgi:hypothetical protein
MLRVLVLVFSLVLQYYPVYSQDIDTAAIKKQLAAIFERDQKTRKTRDSVNYVRQIDSSNLVQIEALINKYGWLGKSFVGSGGNTALFAVIQHADPDVQEKYFPLLQRSVADGESNAYDMAMMQDRILMRREKKQVYGSQVVQNKTTGAWEFYPIEDEKNVNARRSKVGLPPIEEYAKYFGINYKLPADK